MPYAKMDDKLRNNEQWRERNRDRMAFAYQRVNARRRGISWEFTFEEWLAWWGRFLPHRGRGAGKLVMARRGDTGPYAPANCYLASHEGNSADIARKRYEPLV